MDKLLKHFGKNQQIFTPVVHIDGARALKSAIENVGIAQSAGADGVFLIEHEGYVDAKKMMVLREQVSVKFPGFFVGVNCLDQYHTPQEVFPIAVAAGEVPGIWSDASGFDQNGPGPLTEEIDEAVRRSGYRGIVLNSVAFKHQAHIPEERLHLVAGLAKPHMDVLVTSGAATGKAADPNRVWLLRQGLGDMPMAIASGVDIENYHKFIGLVNWFMVASSITKSFNELDEAKTAKLCRAIHEWAL